MWTRAKPTSDTGHNAIEPLAALIAAQHVSLTPATPAEPDDDPWQKHLRRLHGDLIFGDHDGSTASHPPYDHVVELGKHLRAISLAPMITTCVYQIDIGVRLKTFGDEGEVLGATRCGRQGLLPSARRRKPTGFMGATRTSADR